MSQDPSNKPQAVGSGFYCSTHNTHGSSLTETVRCPKCFPSQAVGEVGGIDGASDGLHAENEAQGQQVDNLREALADMVNQFAYKSDGKGRKPPVMFTGGLSALEGAFYELGYPDPKPCPESSCDIKGCQRWPGVGQPRPDGDYWWICGTHRALMDMGDTSLEKKPGRGHNAKKRKERLTR